MEMGRIGGDRTWEPGLGRARLDYSRRLGEL